MIEREAISTTGFWIFDDKLVTLETPSASIEVTQPQEIALYENMFNMLRRSALYGPEARALIVRVQRQLARSN
jgi:hypothetical protein